MSFVCLPESRPSCTLLPRRQPAYRRRQTRSNAAGIDRNEKRCKPSFMPVHQWIALPVSRCRLHCLMRASAAVLSRSGAARLSVGHHRRNCPRRMCKPNIFTGDDKALYQYRKCQSVTTSVISHCVPADARMSSAQACTVKVITELTPLPSASA